MKCVKIVDKKKLEVSEITPAAPTDDKVLFKVKAAGICGSDIHYWDSGEPNGLVMGHEFSGVVVNPGGRKDLSVGDRITGLPISPCGECDACKSGNPQYCKKTWESAVGLSLENPGAFAEFSSCRCDMVKKLPDNVSFEQAAMVEPSSVGLHAVNLANLKGGEKVLIIGAGIIGLMSAEFAKLQGADYIAVVEANKERGKKSVEFGIVNEYYDALDEKTIPTLVEKTNGGFDVVIECCGNSAAVSEAMMLVKGGGTIVLVGVSMTPITVPMVVPVMAEVTMKGAIAYTVEEFESVIDLISNKKLIVEKYIDDIVSLDRVQESFERLTSGTDSAVKIIVKP